MNDDKYKKNEKMDKSIESVEILKPSLFKESVEGLEFFIPKPESKQTSNTEQKPETNKDED